MHSQVDSSQGQAGLAWSGATRGHLGPRMVLACLVMSFFVISLATVCRWPLVWCDEPYFVDPAFHLAQEGRFVSEISSRHNDPDLLWEGNCPLYSIVLGWWMRVLGFSLFAARSLNVVLYTIAAAMLAVALDRLQRLRSISAAVLLAVGLYSCYSLVFGYRQCRYEPLCIMECAAVFLVLTTGKIGIRHILLVLVCSAIPWSGFPAVAWLFGAFAAGSLVFGRRILVDGVFAAIGITVGLASLATWFHFHGVLDSFAGMVGEVQDRIPFSVAARLRLLANGLLRDRGLWALWAAALTLLVAKIREGSLRKDCPVVVAILVALAGAIVQVLATSRAYDWTVAIPLVVGVVAELGGSRPVLLPERLAAITLTVAASMGLPSTLLATAYEWNERDHSRVDRFVASEIRKDDYCFCDITAYFPARALAERLHVDFGTLYNPGIWDNVEHHATNRTPFTVMIVRSDRGARTIEEFGGGWEEVARLPPCPPTWPPGSWGRGALERAIGVLYPPPLGEDAKRTATDRMYDLIVLRPTGRRATATVP